MSDLNGDLLVADEKIEQGTEWQDTMKVPIAGEKLAFGFTLLDERVRQRVLNQLDLDEFRDYRKGGRSEEHERLIELQRKDELSEDEEEELLDLIDDVNPEEEGRDALPDDAIDALMKAGKHAIEPTDGDLQDILAADPPTQERILGHIPEGGKDDIRDDVREYQRDLVESQPFPIKFQIGQRAFMETMSVLGNGFQSQST